ncbi:MAG: serine/threonine-protein kinase [Aggregatilineales bacterium]
MSRLTTSLPGVGRRTDSLFDNRYRYDYIYPRGRSGEVLRAYDTLDADRPVVIKRPAPQDAPPMRAGQEVSILNEKRALERLAGHPALAELRRSGTFRIGGQTHQYIVLDLAEGITVEEYVLELAGRGERLPELETLVILDRFLDLLEAAHARQVAYNDADAKHLFWDRANYRLKVIDWGNAVFLDGDARTEPPRPWRAIDATQAAEVLYFILSGGHRLDVGRGDPTTGLPDTVSPKLKTVLGRASDPDPSRRYPDVTALRRDVADARRPLEKARDQLIERVQTRLPGATSQNDLTALLETTGEALVADPGFPTARELQTELELRLNRLAIQGDLDAARIYIESGSPVRARALLSETLTRAGESEQPTVHFLLDVAAQLAESKIGTPPAGLAPALDALFRGDPQSAGRALVTTYEARPDAFAQQLLLAERLTLRVPGVALLRPHLARLDQLLIGRSSDRGLLMRLTAPLDNLSSSAVHGVQPIREVYAHLAESLDDLAGRWDGDLRAAAERAGHAAADIAQLLDVTAQNVLADPTRAGNALWRAGAIDPANPAFDGVNQALNAFHAELETLAGAVPDVSPDSPDALTGLLAWLTDVRAHLAAYEADLPDPQFAALRKGVDDAIANWYEARDALALGGRRPAANAYLHASELIRPLNPIVAGRFEALARQVEDARYVETLSPNAAAGRALAEGWEAWDRGRNADAQAAAERAYAAAQTDGERQAADRLERLATLTAAWFESDGLINRAVTERILTQVNGLLLPAESQLRQKFTDQMPNMTIYVKAMVRGLVEPMRDASSAAGRVLLLDYILRGVLAMLDEEADTVATWREAAARATPNIRLHPIYQALEQALTRRQLLTTAVGSLNTVQSLADLPNARQAVRAPVVSAQLDSAEQALRSLDDACRRWGDGDFRAARQIIDSANERIANAERAINAYFFYPADSPRYVSLKPFSAWLGTLSAGAEACYAARRVIEQAALIPADQPDPAVESAHRQIVDRTWEALGEEFSSVVRQWRDTYITIRQTYQDPALTKSEKARLFDGHFASLFIDRHPAYAIYRHWQSVIALMPDLPPTYVPSIPLTRGFDTAPNFVDAASAMPVTRAEVAESVNALPPPIPAPAEAPETRFPWLIGLAVVGAILIAAVIGFLALQNRTPSAPPLTVSPSPASSRAATLPAVAANPSIVTTSGSTHTGIQTHTVMPVPPTATPTPTNTQTQTPTATPIPFVPTETHAPSSITPVVPATSGATIPPVTPSASPSATGLPSGGSIGTPGATLPPNAGPTIPPDAPPGPYDLLQDLTKLTSSSYTWPSTLFAPAQNGTDGSWQLGTTDPKAGNAIQLIRIGPSTLGALYGPAASRRLTRAEATLTVTNYDPALMATGNVYFGLGMEAGQGQRATAQVKVIQVQVITLGTTVNGRFTARSIVPSSTLKITLAVQRNSDHTVSLYADGQLLGTTVGNVYGPTVPVSIVLYTSAQSVTVSVSAMSIRLGAQ